MKYFLRLIRALNLTIIVFTQFIARIFIIGPKENWLQIIQEKEIILLSLGTVLIAAAGYIINDYYDVKIDVINKPKKMVIDRNLSRRNALVIHSVFNMIAIVIGFYISLNVMLFFLTTTFLLWIYSNQLKRIALIGNLVVASLSASSILILGLYYHDHFQIILFFTLMSFLMSLVREIIKDMEDIKGDLVHGCKTLPIAWGITKTKVLIYFILALLMALFLFYQIEVKYFGSTINGLLSIVILYLGVRLYPADTKKDFDHLSMISKVILLLGVVAIIFTSN